jgi:hypothetical protein
MENYLLLFEFLSTEQFAVLEEGVKLMTLRGYCT